MGVETLLEKENGDKYLKEWGFDSKDSTQHPSLKEILERILPLENRLLLSNMQQDWVKEEAAKTGFCHTHYTYNPLSFSCIKKLLSFFSSTQEKKTFYSFYSPMGIMGFCAHLLGGFSTVKEFQNLSPHKEMVQHLVNKYQLNKHISTHYLASQLTTANLDIPEDLHEASVIFLPSLVWDYEFKEKIFSKIYQQCDRETLILTNSLPPKKFLSYFLKKDSFIEESSWNPQQFFYICKKKSPSIDQEMCFLSWVQPNPISSHE